VVQHRRDREGGVGECLSPGVRSGEVLDLWQVVREKISLLLDELVERFASPRRDAGGLERFLSVAAFSS
jgi:hypothetical protein